MNRVLRIAALMLAASASAQAQSEHDHHQHAAPLARTSEIDEYSSAHVAPAPPSSTMAPMSPQEMNAVMEMNDAAHFGKVMVNELEWIDDDSLAWDLDAWYGGDFDKLWIRSEGEQHGADDSFNVEALWDHVFARWWSVQGGIRYDEVAGESRSSLVLGVQGLAPQWFDVEASLHLNEDGVVSLHTEVDYELLLTQRWVLQPSAELTANSTNDRAMHAGSGLSALEIGLRLRYEIRREIAPYVGIRWTRRFGNTADFARNEGLDVGNVQAVAGIKLWF